MKDMSRFNVEDLLTGQNWGFELRLDAHQFAQTQIPAAHGWVIRKMDTSLKTGVVELVLGIRDEPLDIPEAALIA